MDKNDFISHYGVSKRDGAKLGSGRYPLGSGKNPQAEKRSNDLSNLPVSINNDITIKAGTVITRYANQKEDESSANSRYFSVTKDDNAFYKRCMRATYKEHNEDYNEGDGFYEKQYKVTKDLKIPSQEKMIEAYISGILLNPNDKLKSFGIDPTGAYAKVYDRSSTENDQIKLDDVIEKYGDMKLSEAQSKSVTYFLNHYESIAFSEERDAVVDELKKMGYNAMLDENDRLSNRNWYKSQPGKYDGKGYAEAPIIIFDPSSDVEKISDKQLEYWGKPWD